MGARTARGGPMLDKLIKDYLDRLLGGRYVLSLRREGRALVITIAPAD